MEIGGEAAQLWKGIQPKNDEDMETGKGITIKW